MATFEKFEDMEAWQKARSLSRLIYEDIRSEPFSKDFGLKDQITRSSGSVMDNISEGFDRGGKVEFIHFLTISKGSAGEVKSQLYRASDQNYISEKRFNELYTLADDVSRMISGLISYLNKTSIKGFKFKDRRK